MLHSLSHDVCNHVLKNNWSQSRLLSLDEIRSKQDVSRFERSQTFFEERINLNTKLWQLPSRNTYQRRRENELGLYRPELAILSAAAKLDLSQALEETCPFFNAESLKHELLHYFPETIRLRYEKDIMEHALARPIALTMLTNHIIDHAGASFIAEASIQSGQQTEAIVKAYLKAESMLNALALREKISDIELSIAASLEYRARLLLKDSVEVLTTWLLDFPEYNTEKF